MGSNRNREAGHAYERLIRKELEELGYDMKTTREESRSLDAEGVDLIGNFPYLIQCKTQVNQPNFIELLKRTCNLVFLKKTKKANTRFVSEGEIVVMSKETFYDIVKELFPKPTK